MRVKRFSVTEANALLPELAPVLTELADALHAYQFARAQLSELETVNAATAADPAHPDHADLTRFEAEAREAEKRAERLLRRFADAGVEVKDPFVGLLDFPTVRDGEEAYLCWRAGEEEITHWHPLSGGFGARKPL